LPTLAGHGSITFLGGAAAHIAMPGTVGRAAVHGALFANAAERLPAGKTGEPHEIAEAVTLCVTPERHPNSSTNRQVNSPTPAAP
jgi:hypothetical protein